MILMILLSPLGKLHSSLAALDPRSRFPRHGGLSLGRKLAGQLLIGLGLIAGLHAAPALPVPHDINPTPEHPRNTEGSFVTLRSGRILFNYSQFSEGQHDHSPSAIAEIYSDDQGRI